MTLSGKEMLKLFLNNGWIKVRQKGSHVTVRKDDSIETIPVYARELGKGLESKLLKRLNEV